MEKKIDPILLRGTVSIPPSKSDAQRAILAAALVKNATSVIRNIGASNDVKSMLSNIKKLNASFSVNKNEVSIFRKEEFSKKESFFIGESGLGLRLLAGVLACIGGEFSLSGEGSISRREHSFFEEHFPNYGVSVTTNHGKTPVRLSGKIQAGEITVDGSQSSQYISGLLFGLPLLHGNSMLTVNNMVSSPYLKMTLATLKEFGILIEQEKEHTFFIPGKQEYRPAHYLVEGDWSGASYWLVASALGHDIQVKGLSPKSDQADKALLNVFQRANCKIEQLKDGISINGTQRKAFHFDATDCPDLFPALVTLAAFTEGESIIEGVSRLSNKESHRGKVLKKEFEKLGVKITLNGNKMHIFGGIKTINTPQLEAHNDHRIAMCLAIAGTKTNKGVVLSGAESVNKSYPEFWNDFELLKTKNNGF